MSGAERLLLTWVGGRGLSIRKTAVSYRPVCVCAESLQSCLPLCDPADCSPLGSSVHGVLQARILEWAAIPFSCRHAILD